MTSIQITKNAWTKIREILHVTKNKYGMVYSASSGGCNGFNFELDLLTEELHKQINENRFSGSSIFIDFFYLCFNKLLQLFYSSNLFICM